MHIHYRETFTTGWSALEKRLLPSYVWTSDPLTFWRERILFLICFIGVVFGPIALVPSLLLAYSEGLWIVILVDSLAYMAAVTILIARNASFVVRALVICFILYALGVCILFILGPVGAGYIWLFGASVLISTFIGVSAAIWTLVFNTIVMLSVGIFIAYGNPAWILHMDNALEKWLVMSTNFLLLNAAVTITTAFMLNSLKTALLMEQKTSQGRRESEELFRSYLVNAPDGVYMSDLNGTFLYGNRKSEEIIGYRREELIGKNFLELNLLTEKDLNKAVQWLQENMKGNPTGPDDIELISKEGRIIPVEINTSVVQRMGQEIILAFVRNITDRKNAEEKLRESERQYRLLTEKMSDIIWIADMNLRTTYISPSVKNVLGFSQEERMRQTLDKQLTPNSLSLVLDVLSKEITLEKQGNADPNRKMAIELEYYHKDGSTRWMDLVINGIRNDQGVLTSIHGVSREITDRKRAENALTESENKYRLLADNIHDVVFFMDMNLNYTYISPSVKILRGYEPKEAMKHTPAETLTPSSVDFALSILSEILELEKSEHGELNISRTAQLEMTRKDGTTVWVETKASIVRDENQQPIGIMGVTRDITERKKVEDALRESEEKYRTILENIDDGYYEVDITGNLTFFNDSMSRILGYPREEMMGMNNRQYTDKENAKKLFKTFNEVYKTGKTAKEFDWEIIRKDGTKRHIEVSVSIRRNSSGQPIGFQGIARDITDRKRAEDALRESEHRYQELSIIDDLTQLYNSRQFYSQLEKEIERANRYEQPLTLLLLDLDNFKTFNDTYGHVEGDNVLSRLGQVIKECLRETDSAFRYGGEEFTIILPMTTSEEGMITAQRIQTELRKETFSPVMNQKVYMTVSIGLSHYRPKEEMKTFVHRVDQLMYQAKKNGRDRICPES